MTEKKLPRAVTYEDDKRRNPWEKLKEKRGVRIIDTARVGPKK